MADQPGLKREGTMQVTAQVNKDLRVKFLHVSISSIEDFDSGRGLVLNGRLLNTVTCT